MNKEFSNAWIGSRQPRKQRKYLANAPLHIRHKLMSAHLSKELRKKYGKRNFPLRKGDSVKVMRGEYKKKTGKIESVNMGKLKVLLEGVYKSKKDGTKIKIHFQPSNLLITELNTDDKKRTEALNRKFTAAKKTEVKKEAKKVDKPSSDLKKSENHKKPEPKKIETKTKPINKTSSRQSLEGHKK
jgi:large subunit ribosomal protein L24